MGVFGSIPRAALPVAVAAAALPQLATVFVIGAESNVDPEPPPEPPEDLVSVGASTTKQRRPRVRVACAPELGLVMEAETAKTYAKNAQRFCNTSSPWAENHLNVQEVLGFVAPWSDHGYRAARYFRGKLSQVSPLWFRVLPGKGRGSSFEITGWDLADEQRRWTKQAGAEFCLEERCGDGPDVLPHFSFEGFDKLPALRAVLEAPMELAAEIVVTCEKGGFQGAVLDVRLALFPSLRSLVPALVAAIGRALRAGGRRFLLSVPAQPAGGGGPAFDTADASAVAGSVDGVVLGTRDYSRKQPGPAAPLPWVRASALRLLGNGQGGSSGLRPEQLLLEVPLYGRAFQDGQPEGKVIDAVETVKVLAKQQPDMAWDAEAAEHSAELTKGKVWLSIPTLAFVNARLQLAHSLGVGVALRDLGAGFDASFDLLPMRFDGQQLSAAKGANTIDAEAHNKAGVSGTKDDL